MPKDYEYKGPGVTRPHPRKNWVNPDARPVTGPQAGRPWGSAGQRGAARRGPRPDDRSNEPGPSEPGPSGPGRSAGRSGRSPLQLFAGAVGLVFLLLGIAGFIPGVTEMSEDLATAGTDSRAEVFGLFRISVLHNIVHLLFGLVGLLAATQAGAAKLYLLLGGIAYLGIAAYGFLIDEESDANFLPLNDADNLLHVGLSVLMIALALAGIAAERRRPAPA